MDVVVSEGAEKERNQPMVAAWFAVKGRSHFSNSETRHLIKTKLILSVAQKIGP